MLSRVSAWSHRIETRADTGITAPRSCCSRRTTRSSGPPAVGSAAPDDYLITTDQAHRARPRRDQFGHAGLEWQRYVKLDPALIRPAEVDHLIGDASKNELEWAPAMTFDGLVKMMVDADVARLSRR